MKATTTIVFLLLALLVKAQCDSLSFSLQVTQPDCSGFGSIQVTNLKGSAPFEITNDGSHLAAGTYNVQVKDACGNIRTRTATLNPYSFDFGWSVSYHPCAAVEFTFSNPSLLYSLDGVNYFNRSSLSTVVHGDATQTIYAEDSCGNVVKRTQFIPKEAGAYIKRLRERIKCNGQEIYPEYFGFNSPTVCLYKYPQRTLVECKQAPPNYNGGALTNFLNLPFGNDYYVIVQDGCNRDSAFFKDKTSAGGSELNPFAWHCNTFDLHSDGNNDNPICIYRKEDNSIVACKPGNDTAIDPSTGKPWEYGGAEFYGLPYGSYYSLIFDPCTDTVVRIDTTVTYPYHSFSTALSSCAVGQSYVAVNYSLEAPMPWTTRVYWPNDSLVGTFASSGSNWYHNYPTYPYPGAVKVVTEDGCGKRDTSYITQPTIFPIRKASVKGGCPGASGESGSGDIIITGTKEAFQSSSVRIVSKDGTSTNIPSSYTQVSDSARVYFTNLSTGKYIIESTLGCYGFKTYDTVEVKPYEYPKQYLMLAGCSGSFYTFKDSVAGGVGPFKMEMTSPAKGTIASPFLISADTVTRLQVQITDACGNSHSVGYSLSPVGCRILAVGTPQETPRIKNEPVKVYPNPSNSSFTISFSNKRKQDYEVEVYTAMGQCVQKLHVAQIDKYDLKMSLPYAKGVYTLVIRSNSDVQTIKHILL